MSLKSRGMFGEAKSKTLAKIVKLDTLDNAEVSTRRLLNRFFELKTRDAKVRTKRATVLAANRARIIANNTLDSELKKKKLKIAKLYMETADKMILK